MKYNKLEKIIARIIDYPIADADEDKPDLPILPVKQAKVALYGRAIDRFVMWLTCFFIKHIVNPSIVDNLFIKP